MTTNSPSLESTVKSDSELRNVLDQGFIWLTRLFALAVAGTLLWIAIQVTIGAWPAIQKYGLGFLINSAWNPVNNDYGVLPQIYGTVMSSLIGLLIAVPIGVGTAILLSENLLPIQIRTVLVFLVELLAAIPSVVYGIWGIFVLIPILNVVGQWIHTYFGWIPFFSTIPTGPGMFPGAVILAVMIIPIITAISKDALNAVPFTLRQASVGLGATRWETIFQVIIPAAFSGIVSAVMLALGRAMGETMAVTMLIGNANSINISIFAPANTIASLLANQFSEASGLQVGALMYAGLVLFILTLVINVFAELIVLRVKRL